MSCGDPHETEELGPAAMTAGSASLHPLTAGCREVLAEVYLYLDLESPNGRREVIERHLDECAPCLREYGIEQEVKQLVGRCCGAETAPAELRERLRRKLAELVAEGTREHQL